MSFNEVSKEFEYNEEQYRQDEEEDEPDNVRMAKRCLPAMNSINPSLKFTTDAPEDYPRDRLPTLDFVLWMVDGILFHTYYEKTYEKPTHHNAEECNVRTSEDEHPRK